KLGVSRGQGEYGRRGHIFHHECLVLLGLIPRQRTVELRDAHKWAPCVMLKQLEHAYLTGTWLEALYLQHCRFAGILAEVVERPDSGGTPPRTLPEAASRTELRQLPDLAYNSLLAVEKVRCLAKCTSDEILSVRIFAHVSNPVLRIAIGVEYGKVKRESLLRV